MMSLLGRFWRSTLPRACLRDRQGTAAIEFSAVGALLCLLMAGALDMGNALVMQRDVRRLAAEITLSLSACGVSQDCMVAMVNALNTRSANVLVGYASASLGVATIVRKNNTILVQSGTMTYLPSDIAAQAMALFEEGDCGAASLITFTNTPFMAGFAGALGLSSVDLRSFNVNLSAKSCQWI